jgi:hypothetical protein
VCNVLSIFGTRDLRVFFVFVLKQYFKFLLFLKQPKCLNCFTCISVLTCIIHPDGSYYGCFFFQSSSAFLGTVDRQAKAELFYK